jgi:hypothetical protein
VAQSGQLSARSQVREYILDRLALNQHVVGSNPTGPASSFLTVDSVDSLRILSATCRGIYRRARSESNKSARTIPPGWPWIAVLRNLYHVAELMVVVIRWWSPMSLML